MEISKERKAFEEYLAGMKIHNLRVGTIFDTEKNEYFASDVLHPSEDHIVGWINFSWKLWQDKSTPEGFVLDAPARVGGGVFREGVKWKTVIESAQRLYEHSKDEIKPIVSPADILKIASGELVLVPKKPTEQLLSKAIRKYLEVSNLSIITNRMAHLYDLMIQEAMIEAQEQSHD